MGTSSLFVVLLISSAASLEQICPSNILKKFLSDPQKAKEHYENGETVNVTCPADSDGDGYEYNNYDNSDGLDMKNIKVLTCNDGKWVGHYPECFSNCSKPDIDAILNPEYKMYAPGDNVTVMACKNANASIEGDTQLICMADGTWIGSAICPKLHRSCNEQPPTISNAYITDVVLNEYTHGTVLRYKCSQAFDQMGKHSVTCNEGQWIPDSANLIQCIIGHCSHIYSRELDNMRVKNISGQVGTYAEFECYDGYELEGSAKILCMADRKWYPEIPKCKPISCPPPKQILNGRFIQEAYDGLLNIYQSTTRYDCDKGYRIVGPRFRKCQSDRTWSGNDTKCEEIICEKPSNPENGNFFLTDNSLKIGSQIEYICDELHAVEPITSQFAICTVHGRWSSPQPRCIKICKVRALTYGLLRTISGIQRQITEDSYVLENTDLQFTCNYGYERYASGYGTWGRLKCVNGTLLPGSPECRPQRCFISPTTNMQYFIGQEQVLENYIHSGIVMNVGCSNKTELFRSSSYLEREQVLVQCFLGKFQHGLPVCKDKRCNIIETVDNGHFISSGKEVFPGEKILSGSSIQLKCSAGYELDNNGNYIYRMLEQTDISCYQGSFTSEIPSCVPKRCFIAPSTNLEYYIGEEKVLDNNIQSGIVMNARCTNTTEMFLSPAYLEEEQVNVTCYFGTLDPGSPVCMDKRCNIIATVDYGHFISRGKEVFTGEKILSGSNIQLKCSEGYELYHKANYMYLMVEQTDIKCYQGSFTSELPSCVPKRCFIAPSTNLEYYIGEDKVLYTDIQSGIVMNARCSNKTEMFLSPAYLEEEQVNVTCYLGTLDPGSPVCMDKRCNIIATVDNGHFISRGKEVFTGEKIISGSNIQLKCSEGYEPYNKAKNMYLMLEQTYIMCYQGSFTSEIPSCEPKRCLIAPSSDLEYFIGEEKVLENSIPSGIVMNARCSNTMELFNSSSYLEEEQVNVTCNLGRLEPELPVCKEIHRSCNEQPPTISNAYIADVVLNEYKHGTVLRYRCSQAFDQMEQYSVTCNDGKWIPDSTNLIRCITTSCPPPKQILNGRLIQESYDGLFNIYQSTIRYECDKGYRIVGPQFRKCQFDRTWTGNDTKCEEIVCEKPSKPENGNVYLTNNSQKVGSKIEYICDELHTMEPITSKIAICTEQGNWSRPQPRCIKFCKVRALTHGLLKTSSGIQRKITEDSYVHYNTDLYFTCNDRYERYASGYGTSGRLKCVNGALLPGSPECRPQRCVIEPTTNLEYFVGEEKILDNIIQSGIVMNARCSNKTELFRSSSYLKDEHVNVTCYHGKFQSELPVCKDKRCNIIATVDNGHFIYRGKEVLIGEKIISGSYIQLKCYEGYELNNKPNDGNLRLEQTYIMCYQGSFTSEIPSCVRKGCFIAPSTNLEYFIGEEKVLGNIIQSGIVMNARCSNKTELFRSSLYLEEEQVIVTCYRGTLRPESPVCRDKRCNIIATVDNGHLISRGKVVVTGEKIFSGSNIQMKCSQGYALYNKTTSTYLNLEQREIKCYQGSFTSEIPSCVPKRCNTPVLTEAVTGFVAIGNKSMPDNFFPHDQSVKAVCKDGYRQQGTFTCQEGIWRGNSTCEPDVTGCVLKDPGMHIISLGNRKVLKVGENANVSCKFGYQIVPSIFAKREYEYDYPNPESTADPSEIKETEDMENILAVGDGNYTCIENGTWEPELRFSCKQIVCDSFDAYNLENGKIIYSSHFDYTVGTVASFHCDPGYIRHGPENRTCQIDGTWSGPCVTCQTKTRNASSTCPAPCVPVGARKTGSHPYEIGSIVKFHCPRSKTQDRDENSIYCIENGTYATWNGTMIDCKEIICDKGDHYGFENGRVTYSSSVATVGTEASFKCNNGYTLIGNKTRICQKDGNWSPGCVMCQKHQPNSSICPAPCVPDGARKIGSLSYEIGSIIQLYCFQSNMDFNINSTHIRHCVNNGTSAGWNGSNINCKAKCKPLTDSYNIIQNGVIPGILSDKTVVELNCNRSQSQVQAVCRQGVWKPKKPTCESTCRPLIDSYNIVKNGVVPGILSDKTVVELNCSRSPPFYIKTAECINGSWKPNNPTCEYPCLLAAVNGTLYNYKVTQKQVFGGPIVSGRQIKVTCEDGFFLNKQHYDVSKCVNGVWTPEIVKCEKRETCLLTPAKGTRYNYYVTKDPVSQGPIESGRHIQVTCENGFLPNNQTYNVSKCVNGVWYPEIVKCEKTDNCSLIPGKGTRYNYYVTREQVSQGPIASNRQIEVTCEDGFLPSKKTYNVSRCVHGVWTPEIVKCEKTVNF